ncbi:Mitochondrial ATPase inhibitor, IATP domain containing protein [Rhypophila sp. PSN 637]
MLRTSVLKAVRPAMATRTLATSARVMAAGDTGAPPKTGGQGDAFQRREKAAEDYAIRQREKEKLLELRKKLHEQQAHLQQLSDHMSVFLRSMEFRPVHKDDPKGLKARDFVLWWAADRHGFPVNGRDENPPFKERPTITDNVRKWREMHSDEITKDQGGEHN